MFRKTLTSFSLIGLLLGVRGGRTSPPAWTKPHVLLGLSLI